MEKNHRKKLKILVINYEFPPIGGGGGIATYSLAREWAKYAEVHVLTSRYKGLASREKTEGMVLHRVPVLGRKARDNASFISMLTFIPSALVRGIFLMLANRYDVINTHFAVPTGPVGCMLKCLFRVHNVLSVHGGDIYDPSRKISPHNTPVLRELVALLLRCADTVIAQSHNTRENVFAYYGIKREVLIVPLPFITPQITTLPRTSLKLRDDAFVIVSIGRLVKRKAFDDLVRSVKKLANTRVQLCIIGDGPEHEHLSALITELDMEQQVHLTGFVDEKTKYAYLKQADLYAMTSLHEGFGIVFMEAMHTGLPIVCTNNGGQTDFLVHEENALLFNVGDIKACAEAINRFILDKALYRKCAEHNRYTVQQFRAEVIAKSYYELFNAVIE